MTRNAHDLLPPDLAQIEALALAAIEALPAPFRALAHEVALRVEDFASEEMLASIGAESPFDLTGLYDGIPLTEKSHSDQPLQPDAIWLFRRAILDEWTERGDIGLGDLVSHVVIHELAHHFGWADDEIALLAPWWE